MLIIYLYSTNFFACHKHKKTKKDDEGNRKMHNIKKNVFV
jgi:hypothetical protein